MNPEEAITWLLCSLIVAFPLALAAAAVILRLACSICQVQLPKFGKAVGIEFLAFLACLACMAPFFLLSLAGPRGQEGRAAPGRENLVANFITLPLVLFVPAAVYAHFLRVTFGKGVLIRLAEVALNLVLGLVAGGMVVVILLATGSLPVRPAAAQKPPAIDPAALAAAARDREALQRSNEAHEVARAGRAEEAGVAFRDALTRWQELADESPRESKYRREQAKAQFGLGELLSQTGPVQSAERAFRDALTLWKTLTAESPDDPEYRHNLARTELALGDLFLKSGRMIEAEAAYRESLAVCKPPTAEPPAGSAYDRELARSHKGLSVVWYRTGRAKEAEAACRRAIALWQPLAMNSPQAAESRSELAVAQVSLAVMLRDRKELREARSLLEQAGHSQRAALDANPGDRHFRDQFSSNRRLLAELLLDQGEHRPGSDAAREFYYAGGTPARDAFQAACWLARCVALAEKDKPMAQAYGQQAVFMLREAVQHGFREPSRKLEDPTLAPLTKMARDYAGQGERLLGRNKPPEALKAFEASLEIWERLAAVFPAVADYQLEAAMCKLGQAEANARDGRLSAAVGAYRNAFTLLGKLASELADQRAPMGRALASLAKGHQDLSILLRRSGRYKEAEPELREALVTRKRLAEAFPDQLPYRQELARNYLHLGEFLRQSGRPAEAEEPIRDALMLQKKLTEDFPAVPQNRQELARTYNDLGLLLRLTRRPAEAEVAYGAALALGQKLATEFPSVADYHNDLAGTMVNLALVLGFRKELRRAQEFLEAALPHHQAALKDKPNELKYREYFRNNRRALSGVSLGLGDHAATADVAQQLCQNPFDPIQDPYFAAALLARCVAGAEQDHGLTDVKRRELARSYGDRAIAALRQAMRNGFKSTARLEKDAVFDSLRSRDDFKKLVAEPQTKK
jgi:tetratricopeptide (TPR) repeat protein